MRGGRIALTSRGALVRLHAAVALFGFAALFGKWIALPALVIVLGRTVIGGVTLALLVQFRDHRLRRPSRALALNGAILAVHWLTFFAAIQVATVAVGLLGYATFPLFVLLLEGRLVPGRARAAEWAVALLASAGLVAMIPVSDPAGDTVRGLALGIVSGFTFALLAVRNRGFVESASAVEIALWQNAFAALCVLPIVALLAGASWVPDAMDVVLLLVLGVVCTGVAHTLFIASMRVVSAHIASVVAALEPVYGVALAVTVLREIPDARTWLGGAMIVAAALVASRHAR